MSERRELPNDNEGLFKTLCDIISEHSEESYCAGWLDGIELTVWEWLKEWRAGHYEPNKMFGIGCRMPVSDIILCDYIHSRIGVWPLWLEGYSNPMPHKAEDIEAEIESRQKFYEELKKRWNTPIGDNDRGNFTPFPPSSNEE